MPFGKLGQRMKENKIIKEAFKREYHREYKKAYAEELRKKRKGQREAIKLKAQEKAKLDVSPLAEKMGKRATKTADKFKNVKKKVKPWREAIGEWRDAMGDFGDSMNPFSGEADLGFKAPAFNMGMPEAKPKKAPKKKKGKSITIKID